MNESTRETKQLVVLSGKGGTGKTSVVAALAALADNKVLADCDVDAADLHLVVNPALQRSEKFTSGKEAVIMPERCSACGLCLDHCRFGAIRVVDGQGTEVFYEVDPMACEGCGLCARVCGSGAVTMAEAERGEWYVSDTRHGPLVHARLNIGGENSGKLVTLVRDQASALADETETGLVLVDGPPGIGCPVIASVTGATLVLAVTEPTISAAHDLERLVNLVEGFQIPLTVCINKVDLNPDMARSIRETCNARGLAVVGELDYDTTVVESQVAGMSIMEHGDSRVATQIEKMWHLISDILEETETRAR